MLLPITIGFGLAAATGNVKNEAGQQVNPIWPALFLVPFWLIGIGCMAGVVHRGRRRAVLAVAGDRLMIMQTGLLSTQQKDWPRQQLRSVRALVTKIADSEGPAGWTTELLIEPVDGPPTKLLGHRTKQEVEWIATTLRQALWSHETSA